MIVKLLNPKRTDIYYPALVMARSMDWQEFLLFPLLLLLMLWSAIKKRALKCPVWNNLTLYHYHRRSRRCTVLLWSVYSSPSDMIYYPQAKPWLFLWMTHQQLTKLILSPRALPLSIPALRIEAELNWARERGREWEQENRMGSSYFIAVLRLSHLL